MTEYQCSVREPFLSGVACPCCKAAPLKVIGDTMRCPSAACGIAYPIVEGRPILVNEKNSIFSFSDYTARRATTMDLELDSKRRRPLWYRIKGLISKLMPNPSLCSTDFPLEEVLEHIAEGFVGDAKLLVIGAGEQAVDFSRGGKVLYTDVAIGNLTNMVCDAHDLPFVDACFDAVIANAVLEHVADPYRCVDEIHRVLRPAGFVYATTPFMQQVHMAQFDFTRFTHLGHRRLFRRFSEERSGVANGPAMVLAWSFERFVAAFAKSKWLYARLRTLARLIIFPIKYFDLVLSRRASAYDAASAYYFMGRKSDTVLSDRELIRLYRGLG